MKRTLRHALRASCAALAASLYCASPVAWAAGAFVVHDIKVDGLQRVDPGTIFATLPFKVGDTYDDDKGAQAIQSLFKLGLFNDVRIDIQGDNVVVAVQERPTIHLVEVSAKTRQIDKASLQRGLASVGITAGQPYDKGLQERAIQDIREQYARRGFYDVQIELTTTPLDRNRVNLDLRVTEGPAARIRQVDFVGNHAVSASTLRGLMGMDTGGWMSWYTKSNHFAEDKLNDDQSAIREYYLNHGYLEFRIDSTQVALSPDKKDISITMNLSEGPRYVVSAVDMQGDWLGRADEFQSLIGIHPGQAYKLADVQETVKVMTQRFGTYGHAFAHIDVQPLIDRESQQVALHLVASPGQRAYVRRIHIAGNNKTRDEVIRREFRQMEAAWYSSDKIRLSRSRVERLGYFNDIEIDTVPVPGAPDQVDLNVVVKERPTGAIQIGAGYSSSDKLSFSFGINQDNIFGSGQSLGLEVNTSKYNRNLSLSSSDPYFTNSGVSRTFSLSHRSNTPYTWQGGSYTFTQQSAGVSFGVPFSEVDTVYFGLGYERYRLQPKRTALPPEYQRYVAQYGEKSFGVPLTVGWGRDSRDSALAPTSGTSQRIVGTISPAGDARYTVLVYNFQHYFPIGKKFALAFNTDLAWGRGMGGRDFPVFKNFYSGGLGSVRGFEQGSLGPKEYNGGVSYTIGGAKSVNANLEFIMPFPGASADKTLRLYTFIDTGMAFGEHERIRTQDFRSSAGLGIRWISPMGPLSLSIGRPIKKFDGDQLQKLQFQIGTSF